MLNDTHTINTHPHTWPILYPRSLILEAKIMPLHRQWRSQSLPSLLCDISDSDSVESCNIGNRFLSSHPFRNSVLSYNQCMSESNLKSQTPAAQVYWFLMWFMGRVLKPWSYLTHSSRLGNGSILLNICKMLFTNELLWAHSKLAGERIFSFNLTIAEWGLFLPRNTLMTQIFFIGQTYFSIFSTLCNTVNIYFMGVNLDLGHCAIHLDIQQHTRTLHNTVKIAGIHDDYSVIL